MIGRLRGMVAAKTPDSVLLDVGGVGYELTITPRGLVDLPSIGEEAVVHVHTHVREDILALYGFSTAEERDLFRVLLGATGIGPKVGVAILGTFAADELRSVVVSEDVDALTAVPGIGKRTAQKLVLELRGRMELPVGELPDGDAETDLAQVREALENLGYQTPEIRDALRGLDGDSVEALLRGALQRLGGR